MASNCNYGIFMGRFWPSRDRCSAKGLTPRHDGGPRFAGGRAKGEYSRSGRANPQVQSGPPAGTNASTSPTGCRVVHCGRPRRRLQHRVARPTLKPATTGSSSERFRASTRPHSPLAASEGGNAALGGLRSKARRCAVCLPASRGARRFSVYGDFMGRLRFELRTSRLSAGCSSQAKLTARLGFGRK